MGARRRFRALLLLPGLLAAAPATAEPEPFLLDLEGRRIALRYTPGSLDRAARLQFRLEEIADSVARWGRTPVSLVVYLLSREEWGGAEMGLPYGLPERMPAAGLALPAWGDAGSVSLWQGLSEALPETEAEPLRGTAAEAAALELSDNLGEVEAARILLGKAGVRCERAWMADLAAHAVVRSTRRSDANRVARASEFYRGLLRRRVGEPLPLSAYRVGIGLAEWLWFQARFREGADLLVQEAGLGAAKALLKLARKHDGRISEARLYDRFPELEAWRRRSFGSAAAGAGAADSLAPRSSAFAESARARESTRPDTRPATAAGNGG